MTELEHLAKMIAAATAPEDVFGPIPKNADKIRTINVAYRQITQKVHPDKFQKEPKLLPVAEAAFMRLTELHRQADEKVRAGTYGDRKAKPPAPKPVHHDPFTVRVGPNVYEVEGVPLYSGDICDLYKCVRNGYDKREVLFKVAQHPGDNDLVENEAKILADLFPKGAKDERFYLYLPRLYDAFMLRGTSNRRVNVIEPADGFVPLTKVIHDYPSGIDFRDMAWMLRRALEALHYVHNRKGIIHGAILPSHILINPKTHGAKIVDWCYAVRAGESKHIKAMSGPFAEAYAPEILAKKPPTPATDIFMAMKCAVYLLSGHFDENRLPASVPAALSGFLRGCLLTKPASRPQDARLVYDEFSDVLQRLVGKPKFREFVMKDG